tara:strand:- start:199 stop:483 length:285 start_codon:yes stop_codon:yes gene_type:complete
MLVELKKLNIVNEGYKRNIFLDKIFVNPNHIISIRDYDGAKDFLISENNKYADRKFCLVKMNNVSGIEEIIALGSSQELHKSFSVKKEKTLLNG